jgi:hypothetical protein
VLVDARDLEPRRDAVLSALDAAGLGDGLRRLVLIDTYEHFLPIDADLCRDLFRRVRDATVVVVAGRGRLAAEWRALALWGTDGAPLALRNLLRAKRRCTSNAAAYPTRWRTTSSRSLMVIRSLSR